jgi:hypothetical protein
MKPRTAPQGAARGALAGAFPAPAIGLPLTVGQAFFDDFAWAGDSGGGGGGGGAVDSVNGLTGDVVLDAAAVGAQPASAVLTAWDALSWAANTIGYATGATTFALATLTSFGRSLIAAADAAAARTVLGAGTGNGDVTAGAVIADNAIVRGDGGAKGVQTSLVDINDSGAVVPRTGSSQQVGNAGLPWLEFWGLQLTMPEQASAQAPSGGWAGRSAFWGRNDAPTSPMFTDDAGTSSKLIRETDIATSSAPGIAEVGTYGEGQTAGALRVADMRSVWEVYRPGMPEWGSYRTSATGGTVTASGSGSWVLVTVVGTFTKTDLGSTYGWVWGYPLSTSTSRGMYTPPGNFTFTSGARVRHIAFFGAATVGDTRMCVGWAASGATLGANIGTVTANVRFGIIDGTIYGICANGTTESRVAFSYTPVNSVIYGFEIIPNRGNTSYTFKLYLYTEAGGPVLQETQTVSASIPSGGSTMGPAIFALARTGTPTAYILGADSVVNLTT